MESEIKKELQRLEREHHIKILYAVESGSRAWGFASKDSDWDVRYVYVHKMDWYLSIDEKKDSYEEILSNDIDLAGWELRKALKLFQKSNPPLLEWLRSPMVYLEQFSTASSLRNLTSEYFNPKSCLYHYLSMAQGNYEAYLMKERVRIKKYFYVLRPILACDWIRANNTMPPMEFERLIESQVFDKILKDEIQELLKRKITGEELNEAPPIKVLGDFLKNKIDFYQEYLKKIIPTGKPKSEHLNIVFREAVYEAWK